MIIRKPEYSVHINRRGCSGPMSIKTKNALHNIYLAAVRYMERPVIRIKKPTISIRPKHQITIRKPKPKKNILVPCGMCDGAGFSCVRCKCRGTMPKYSQPFLRSSPEFIIVQLPPMSALTAAGFTKCGRVETPLDEISTRRLFKRWMGTSSLIEKMKWEGMLGSGGWHLPPLTDEQLAAKYPPREEPKKIVKAREEMQHWSTPPAPPKQPYMIRKVDHDHPQEGTARIRIRPARDRETEDHHSTETEDRHHETVRIVKRVPISIRRKS